MGKAIYLPKSKQFEGGLLPELLIPLLALQIPDLIKHITGSGITNIPKELFNEEYSNKTLNEVYGNGIPSDIINFITNNIGKFKNIIETIFNGTKAVKSVIETVKSFKSQPPISQKAKEEILQAQEGFSNPNFKVPDDIMNEARKSGGSFFFIN